MMELLQKTFRFRKSRSHDTSRKKLHGLAECMADGYADSLIQCTANFY